jgi:DNA polymerase-4
MYQGLRTPKNARVLYLDMNSFFASVEQQRQPALRGIPLAVVSHIGPAGTVLAASQEAKAYGIKTGVRLREAWQMYPKLHSVVTEAAPYRDIHKRFMAILHDVCGPEVRARSIDEAVIPLSRNWYGSEQAHALALLIKERFREELGEYIRCSIGIAPNGFLAKLATDLQKPDGLVEITLENTAAILDKLSLVQLPGIAERSAAHLIPQGIATPLDLYNTPVSALRERFGIWGQYWWWRLHGYEPDVAGEGLKSMSHQHALKHWAHTRAELQPVFYRMADRLIHRLRRNNFQCQQIGIYASLKGRRGITVHRNLGTTCQTYPVLLDVIQQLFLELPEIPEWPIKRIAVYFNQLVPSSNGYQLDLFQPTEKYESISRALELVRGRYGFESIQRGNVAMLDKRVAKEQLGFGRIKDI